MVHLEHRVRVLDVLRMYCEGVKDFDGIRALDAGFQAVMKVFIDAS